MINSGEVTVGEGQACGRRPIPSSGIAPRFGVTLLVAVVAFASSVSADALRIGQYWKKGITFEYVEGGRLIYLDSGGDEREVDLAKITALKTSAYPALGEAHDAIDKGADGLALKAIAAIHARVRQPWLRQWIAWHRMQCHVRRGEAKSAAIAYLDLVRLGADDFYVAQPPVGVLGSIDGVAKREIHDRASAAMARAEGTARTGIDAMLAALGSLEASKAGAARRMPAASPDGGAVSATPTSKLAEAVPPTRLGDAESAVELPAFIRADDPVTHLLQEGSFREAVEEVDRRLNRDNATLVNMRWYQRGVARRALADMRGGEAASSEETRRLYLLAGLDFMRVVVHFPTGRYRPPSLVEAGAVHAGIGRPAQARRLYEEAARPPHAVDAKAMPRYFRRLHQLIDRLPEAP